MYSKAVSVWDLAGDMDWILEHLAMLIKDVFDGCGRFTKVRIGIVAVKPSSIICLPSIRPQLLRHISPQFLRHTSPNS